MSRGLGAAVVGGGLGDPGRGRAVFVMVQRARPIFAALPARLGRRLPSGTAGHGALRQRQQTDDRRRSSQEPPHVIRMPPTSSGVKSWPLRDNSRRLTLERAPGWIL